MSVKEKAGKAWEEAGEAIERNTSFTSTGKKMEQQGREVRDEELRKKGESAIPTPPGTGYKGNK